MRYPSAVFALRDLDLHLAGRPPLGPADPTPPGEAPPTPAIQTTPVPPGFSTNAETIASGPHRVVPFELPAAVVPLTETLPVAPPAKKRTCLKLSCALFLLAAALAAAWFFQEQLGLDLKALLPP